MRKPRLASVQQHYVEAREVMGEVLCLFAPLSPTKRRYCTVLEVSTINFVLKAEEEQDALVERYHGLLTSLTFPIQILVRNERLDLRPTLARVQAQIPEGEPEWEQLASGFCTLLQQVGSQRTLMERHCYLVIPAPDLAPGATRFALRKKRRQAHTDGLVARALQELSMRVEMVQTQLAALGLRSRRLVGEELACLYQRVLSPERARLHPLDHRHLASVGHLPQVRWQTTLPRSLRGGTRQDPVFPVRPPRQRPRSRWWRKTAPRPGESRLPPPDLLRLADLLAPASISEERDALRVEDEYVRTLVVTAFPHEVSSGGWLAPLLMLDEELEISFHLHPQNQAAMLRQLTRRRVGFASARAFHRRQGHLDDPTMEAAQQDVSRLMRELASGDERMMELSFLLLLRAPTKEAISEKTDRVRALLQGIFLDGVVHPATFEHGLGLRSILPQVRDVLRRTILLDATSVATLFPFLSNALAMPGGTFLGLTGTGEPVLLNPWDARLENPSAFVGGVSGAGKSTVGKVWMERDLLLHGREAERIAVIDPDGEYHPLPERLGGSIVRLAAGSAHCLNPFDLIPPGSDFPTYLEQVTRTDRLAEKIQDLHSLLDLMLADRGSVLSPREKALLDRALYEVYRRVGISLDPRTHFHPPPLMRDLEEVLRRGVCGQDESELGLRLSRYVEGSLAGIFSEQTNVQLDSPLLVWDVRDLRGDLRPIGIFLIADCIWTQAVSQRSVRRALYIDEAASLIEHPEGGKFLANLVRRARKRSLRLVVMTQSPESFVQDEWGSVIASNTAIKMLKKQDRTSIQAVASRFGLTRGEAQRLLTFGVQEALLLAGDRRVVLSVAVNDQERALIATGLSSPMEEHG